LPLLWNRMPKPEAFLWKIEGDNVTKLESVMPYQTYSGVAGEVTVKGQKYYELERLPAGLAKDPAAKLCVSAKDVIRLEQVKQVQEKVQGNEVWVDVDIVKQTLVIYEGSTPPFATLIASGAGGKTRFTPMGTFRIYSKHLSSRMSAEEKPAEKEGDEAEHA